MEKIKRKIIKYWDIPKDASPQTRWLMNVMNEYDLDCAKLAKKIHVSRQSVCNWVHDYVTISFSNVCAIVLMIDKYADPENIYQLIKRKEN